MASALITSTAIEKHVSRYIQDPAPRLVLDIESLKAGISAAVDHKLAIERAKAHHRAEVRSEALALVIKLVAGAVFFLGFGATVAICFLART